MQDKSRMMLKIIAVIEFLIAAGIISFWVAFFSTDLMSIKDPKLKEIYLAFESAFPIPDTWLAVSLIIGGIGLLKKRQYGYLFSLIGGASLLFLGLVDISFNVLNGIYLVGIEEAILNISINLLCLIAGVFIIYIVWRNKIKGKNKEVVL